MSGDVPSVGVVIATYGNRLKWAGLARRAIESVERQTHEPDEVIWQHEDTLMDARNKGCAEVGCERTIFLDADDELDEYYVAEMLQAEGDIIQPSTLGIVGEKVDPFPVLIPEKNLIDANYIVIGAMVNTDLFWKVGGFQHWTYAEDWALWLAMFCAGAKISKAPKAIYRVHVNDNGRNFGQARAEIVRVYQDIRNQWMAPYQAEIARRGLPR